MSYSRLFIFSYAGKLFYIIDIDSIINLTISKLQGILKKEYVHEISYHKK